VNWFFVIAARLIWSEHAATTVEYALMLGLLAMACLVATQTMALSISSLLALLTEHLL
jgi:Flp pilus assembly pilin Flp